MARILIRKAMPVWFEDSLLIRKALIIKSAGLYDTETGEFMPGWSPEEAFNPDEENPWYDQWDDRGTGLRAHHPAHAFNPKTGELRFNPDGTPAGHHPIDAVINALDKDLHAMFGDQRAPTSGRAMMQMAIDDYNRHHHEDSAHRLPNVDSVEWRRLYANSEYQKGVHPRDKQVRGDHTVFPEGARPLGTYHTNTGNARAMGAASGSFLDSGAIPMHDELKNILHHANNWFGERGYPEIFGGVDKRHYTGGPHVNVNLMTDGKVMSMSTSQMQHYTNTGHLPHGFYSEEQPEPEMPHGTAYSHAMLGHLPRAFNGFGNLGGASENVGVTKRKRFEDFLASAFEHHGFELSDEEKDNFLGTAAANVTFGRAGAKGSKEHTMLRNIAEELGLDPNEVAEHRKGIRGGGKGSGGGRGRHHFAADVGAHVVAAGPEAFKNATHTHPRLAYDEKYDTVVDKVAEAMNKVYGHQLHEFGELPEGGMPDNLPGSLGQVHQAPPHWEPHFLGPHNLAPSGSMRQDEPVPSAITPSASVPTRQATPEELGQREYMSRFASPQALETAASSVGMRLPKPELQFAGTRPGQQFFDPTTGEMVLRSKKDISDTIDRIQKAMEKMQLENAMSDGEIMKHVPSHSISSSMEMGMFAKSMGLTGYDVRAINATQGDWNKIADKWQVSHKTVGIIKATCNGVGI